MERLKTEELFQSNDKSREFNLEVGVNVIYFSLCFSDRFAPVGDNNNNNWQLTSGPIKRLDFALPN